MHNLNTVLRAMTKKSTAVMTPEAMQAAIQPPMDPSMGGMPPGGAPADPAAMGGGMPPADPAAAGGMPPEGGAPMAQGSGGGEIPPEILQDQLFMQFLQSMGIVFDPQSGTFADPNGQPLSVDEVMQIYDMFQQQVAAQQGGAPAGGAPADPAMAGAPMGAPADPAAAGGMPPDAAMADPAAGMDPAAAAPMDPSMGLPPDAAMGGAPAGPDDLGGAAPAGDPMADPAAMGAPGEEQLAEGDPIMEISSAVMSGVEATLEDFASKLDDKFAELLEKIEVLGKAVDSLTDTTDKRKPEDKDEELALEDELAAELQPTMAEPAPAPMPMELPKAASQKVNLYNFICKKS